MLFFNFRVEKLVQVTDHLELVSERCPKRMSPSGERGQGCSEAGGRIESKSCRLQSFLVVNIVSMGTRNYMCGFNVLNSIEPSTHVILYDHKKKTLLDDNG